LVSEPSLCGLNRDENPTHNPLTTRHGGKADVTFVDGHVEPENQAFGENPNNAIPDL
jgi:prepilin-type processing-associated H-X9-DG protein